MRIDRGELASILRTRDMTGTQLAKMANLSRVTVSNVLCGKGCTDKTAQCIADALQIPVEDITAIRREA